MVAPVIKELPVQVISPQQRTVLDFIETRERVYGAFGSVGSGKTHMVPVGFILYTQRLDRPYLHLIAGRALRQIELEILPHFERLARDLMLPYQYNRSKHIVRIGIQSYVCVAANDESSSGRIQGLSIHSAMFDESALCPESFLDMLFTRLRFATSKLFLLGNPQGPKHYLKEKWIDGGLVDQYHRFRLWHNPVLDSEFIEAVKKAYSGAFRRRMVDGEWSAAEGLIWSQFTRQMPQVPDSTEILVPVDVGMAHSRTAFLVLVKISQGQWHVRQCHLMDSAYTSEDSTAPRLSDLMATTARIVKPYGGKRRCKMVVDASSVGYPYYLELVKEGYRVIRADKWSVMEGLQRTDEKLSDGSLSIDEEDCDELVDDINSFCWAKDKDEPSYTDGTYDPCDALRYGAVAAFGRRDYGIQQVRV